MNILKYSLGLLFCLCMASDVLAYDPAGHMYTANLVTHMTLNPLAPDDAAVITFCTQLPDESSDLDAFAVYFKQGMYSGARWSLSPDNPDMDTRRMITVQQLIHGLTGGDADAVTQTADNILGKLAQQAFSASPNDRPAALCALGFAVHLYGDSFAHRMMVKHGRALNDRCPDKSAHPDGCMYVTGVGHGMDLHYPDWPLCTYKYCQPVEYKPCFTSVPAPADATSVMPLRFQRWEDYGKGLAAHLNPGGSGGSLSNADMYGKFTSHVYCDFEDMGPDSDDWEEHDMESALEQDKTSLGQHSSSTPDAARFDAYFRSTWRGMFNQEQACEVVLSGAFNTSSPVLNPLHKFSCLSAWCDYYKVAMPVFNSQAAARDSLADYGKFYTDSLWDDDSGNPTRCSG